MALSKLSQSSNAMKCRCVASSLASRDLQGKQNREVVQETGLASLVAGTYL